jgi:hypothetical protein
VAATPPDLGLATGTAPNEAAISDHLPFDEVAPCPGPPVIPTIPLRQTVASSEEVIMARFRELEYDLRQALDRLADSENRLSLAQVEATRLRDIEHTAVEALSRVVAVEARLAASERFLLPSSSVEKPLIRVSRMESPVVGHDTSSNLPRESAEPQGRHGKVRNGQRDKKRREKVEHSQTSSDSESGNSSSEEDPVKGSNSPRGPAVSGLSEIVPSRSDYRYLVSYRTYRLENRSQRYDKTITAKLSSYVKRLKHAVEDRFGGEDPIEVLAFLKTFKEAADHNDIGEGAAARLIPYFLKDAAKEGYRAHLDETPSGMPYYPYMVQYLLETYAIDDELARAYMTVTTARQMDGEDERAFGRRLQRAAIRAGNVVDKTNLKTIFVEGLPPFVQAGLRMHLTPSLSFEEVQRLAHNLGVSLRQTMLQSSPGGVKPRVPPGVKSLVTRPSTVSTVGTESELPLDPFGSEEASLREVEVALAHAQLASSSARASGHALGSAGSHPSSPSVVSIPTRGWTSPGGSVASEPPMRGILGSPRAGISRPALCFLCYKHGHMLADCPRLPTALQQEAKSNRDAWQRSGPTERGYPNSSGMKPPNVGSTGVPRPSSREPWPRSEKYSETLAVENPSEVEMPHEKVGSTAEAENDSGSN